MVSKFFGGTDTHWRIGRSQTFKVTGRQLKLVWVGKLNLNKNGIPFDTEKMTITSGIRLGSRLPQQRIWIK